MVHVYHTLAESVTKVVGAAAVIILAEGVWCYLLDRNNPQC
jgi:hypothetical protein